MRQESDAHALQQRRYQARRLLQAMRRHDATRRTRNRILRAVKYQAGRDSALFDAMIELKRHLRSCKACSAARKVGDEYAMCRAGLRLTLKAADRYDLLISLRVQAFKDRQDTVFACPDTTKHGQAYALTALPLHVTGVQDRLI
jgi:hypothetical protein